MPKHHRYFKREFLAKSDDDSNGTAVIARVSNYSEQEDLDWLSAALTLGSVDGYESNFFLSFFGSEPAELKDAVRQVEMLKKIVTEFSDAVAAEVEALQPKKSDK